MHGTSHRLSRRSCRFERTVAVRILPTEAMSDAW
jgi:hypothetical protein